MATEVAMIVRSLTESFIFMRNNAFQTRKLFSNEDNASDDQEIEHQTKELTQLFNLSHKQLNSLTTWRYSSDQNDLQKDKLAKNVISSLAGTLQDLSIAFRKAQSDYLNKLRSRDERIRGYLSSNLDDDELGLQTDGKYDGHDDDDDSSYPLANTQKFAPSSLLVDNTNVVVQREHEINEIVRSIHELNDIFRDVAQLVLDQGTLVDRIDNNVELTQARVQQGLKEITKTHNYQAKNRKMIVIMVLASLVAILGILLIATKFR